MSERTQDLLIWGLIAIAIVAIVSKLVDDWIRSANNLAIGSDWQSTTAVACVSALAGFAAGRTVEKPGSGQK